MKFLILFLALTLGAAAMAAESTALLSYTVKDIDGKEQALEQYRGKVVLVVNVASKCGLTPQYDGLEKLYQAYKDQGLVVIGFPANNFGGQEPGTEAEIKTFCTTKYNVTFPMMAKVSVKGGDIHPLFKQLVSESGGADIEWNFGKFLIGRDGKLVKRISPRTAPDSDELKQAVAEALAVKP